MSGNNRRGCEYSGLSILICSIKSTKDAMDKAFIGVGNPMKLVGLEGHGLEIVDRKALTVVANDANRRYLETKKTKLGHLID